jgi:hypothetical protein
MTIETRSTPRVAIMNAVHDLPVLVARDQGSFRDEGFDLEFVTTPGMAQSTKMLEGFLAPEHVKRTTGGSMLERLEAVRDGRLAARA